MGPHMKDHQSPNSKSKSVKFGQNLPQGVIKGIKSSFVSNLNWFGVNSNKSDEKSPLPPSYRFAAGMVNYHISNISWHRKVIQVSN